MPAPLVPPAGFGERCRAIGVELEAGEIEKLGVFLAMLLDENARQNLTAVRDPDEAWDKHALDALTLMSVLADLPDGAEVVDLGTGGGVPGIPLAVVMPRVRFTLVDATAKKTAFVSRAARAIGVTNVEVVTARAEQLGQDRGEKTGSGRAGGHRERYDAVIARAVGRLATLAELVVPLAKVGGLCALTKGARAEEELEEAKQALHLLHAAHAGTVPTPTGRIVVLEKLRSTPKAYPRRDGEPKKSPLGVGKAR